MRSNFDLLSEAIAFQEQAARGWQQEILESINRHENSLHREIEMTMRNPAVYLDRLNAGEIVLDMSARERWTGLARQAGAICAASYAFRGINEPEIYDNPLMNLQSEAYKNDLHGSVGSLVAAHLPIAADVFGDSLWIDAGRELGYFHGNAQAAQRRFQRSE